MDKLTNYSVHLRQSELLRQELASLVYNVMEPLCDHNYDEEINTLLTDFFNNGDVKDLVKRAEALCKHSLERYEARKHFFKELTYLIKD